MLEFNPVEVLVLSLELAQLPPGIEAHVLNPSLEFPLLLNVVEPGALSRWSQGRAESFRELLSKYGAILLRGACISSPSEFEALARSVTPKLQDYTEKAIQRTHVAGHVYTTTEYSAKIEICVHNECAYASSWPLYLWFHCARPAESGGETPLASGRKIAEFLDEEVKAELIKRRIRYTRNFTGGLLGFSWQVTFGTDSKDAVEDYCRQAGIETEWTSDENLRTHQTRDVFHRHPITGESIWFNQLLAHHVSDLPEKTRERLLKFFGVDMLPKHCTLGDGEPIPESVLAHVRECSTRATVAFPWEAGDVLLVDNMLASHGRRAFTGERTVQLVMADRVAVEA